MFSHPYEVGTVYVGLPAVLCRWPSEIGIEQLVKDDVLFILGGNATSIRGDRGLRDFCLYFGVLGPRLHAEFIRCVLEPAEQTGRVAYEWHEDYAEEFKERIDKMLRSRGLSRISFWPPGMHYLHLESWLRRANPYLTIHVPLLPLPGVVTTFDTGLSISVEGPEGRSVYVYKQDLPCMLTPGERVGIMIEMIEDTERGIKYILLKGGVKVPDPAELRRDWFESRISQLNFRLKVENGKRGAHQEEE